MTKSFVPLFDEVSLSEQALDLPGTERKRYNDWGAIEGEIRKPGR